MHFLGSKMHHPKKIRVVFESREAQYKRQQLLRNKVKQSIIIGLFSLIKDFSTVVQDI